MTKCRLHNKDFKAFRQEEKNLKKYKNSLKKKLAEEQK